MQRRKMEFRMMLAGLLATCIIIASHRSVAYAIEDPQEITEISEAADAAETNGVSVVEHNVSVQESSDLAVAFVEIESYSIESGAIESGENAEILINVHNVSSVAKAVGVMLTISSTSGMIYPAFGNDNQIYIGTIPAKGTKSVTVPITVSTSFIGDYIDMMCRFDYESNGSMMNNMATLMLPSSSGEELYVQSIGLGSKAIINANSLLSISYSNKSKKNIDDAVLIITGNVSDDSKNIKLGSAYAGKSYMKDYHITFKELGQQIINVALSYTSPKGEKVTTDLGNYSVVVTEQLASEQSGPEISSEIIWAGRAVAVIALIIAGVVMVLYIRKR